MKELIAIILAAGKGSRMNSELPKVLHKVGGKPMLQHVMNVAETAGATKNIVVIGYLGEQVKAYVGESAEVVEQKEQLGTAHAVLQVKENLKDFSGAVMILCGDTPLLDAAELQEFFSTHERTHAAATVLTAVMQDPTGYGRIVRDADGKVLKIVEHKDASAEELAIAEVNTGIYCINAPLMFEMLEQISCNNAQGEFYLTDIIHLLVKNSKLVLGVKTNNPASTLGVNSRQQLALAEKLMRERTLDKLMSQGVTIMNPESTFIDAEVVIGRDTVIYPFTWLEGDCVIGDNCQIGPNVRLYNVCMGDSNTIHYAYAHDTHIGEACNIGPFVHLRPGTRLADDVRIGNFVEVKNSWVGDGSKLPHLSYIGDADIGKKVNIGCGTITVNYDGKKKYRTNIEDGAFVGCNSNLVAPVMIGENSFVAAGSTITKNVPSEALGVARAKQNNIEGWAKGR